MRWQLLPRHPNACLPRAHSALRPEYILLCSAVQLYDLDTDRWEVDNLFESASRVISCFSSGLHKYERGSMAAAATPVRVQAGAVT